MSNIKNLTNKLKNYAGFTLVELLIVIGLLGAIALIVIAAINPIEQANRARDTRYRSDAGQLVSAIERYFAAKNVFPWMEYDDGATYAAVDTEIGFIVAADPFIGVCGATCDDDGLLITGNELKTEFRNRDFIQNSGESADKEIMVGKAEGTGSSVYACYIPLSKSVREKACTEGNVYTLDPGTGERTVVDTGCEADVDWTGSAFHVCIPE